MQETPKQYVSESELLMREWDYESNSALGFSPDALGINSSQIVRWICPKGHKYDMRIADKAQGQGCPICLNRRIFSGYNDLATTNPDLLDQWDYQKNDISPRQVSRGSGKKYGGNAVKDIAISRQSVKKHIEISGVPFVLDISQFRALMISQLAIQHWLKNGTPQKMGV